MDTKDWNILLVICLVSPFHPTGYKKGLMDTKDSNILLVICLVSPFHPHEGDFRNYFCIQAPPTHAPKRGAGHPVYTVRNKNRKKILLFRIKINKRCHQCTEILFFLLLNLRQEFLTVHFTPHELQFRMPYRLSLQPPLQYNQNIFASLFLFVTIYGIGRRCLFVNVLFLINNISMPYCAHSIYERCL